MSGLKAARCDTCERVESCRPHRTHPDDWWIVFGPSGQLDFCSRDCLVRWFQPHVVQTTSSWIVPSG